MENKNQLGWERPEKEIEHVGNVSNGKKGKKGIFFMDIREGLKKLGVIPQYTELNLFLITVTILLFFIFDSSLRERFFEFLPAIIYSDFLILFILSIVAMIISIYCIFSKRKLGKFTKNILLIYAIYANAMAGILGGAHILEQSVGIMIIFPILNILNGILLLAMTRVEIIDHSSILDVHPNPREIIFGIILVSLIFFAGNFIFKNYWAITFSLCVFYATNLSQLISKSLFKDKDVFNER